MKWTIANARKHFADLVDAASEEPQPVFRRGRLVAAVVGPETFAAFTAWRQREEQRTVAEAFDELRALLEEEAHEPTWPERQDRPNVALAVLGEAAER